MTKRRQKSSKKRNNQNPSPSIIQYNGPSRLMKADQQNDLMTTQINNAGTVATSASGAVTTVFDAYAQMSTPSDWTNLSGLYTEYRILSMEIEFNPWNTYNTASTTVLAPMYTVVDRNNNTPLASVAQAIGYDSCKCTLPSRKFKRVIKMDSIEEAQWIAVASSPATAARLYVKMYSTGNSTTINLYDFVTRIVVQLRGRQ